jgi:hypothetical protein
MPRGPWIHLGARMTNYRDEPKMTEEDARLALLQSELNAIQNSIISFDTITFQIKGWCVTAALAIGGFAVVYHKPVLILIGLAAVTGFSVLNCQFKVLQRIFIRRYQALDSELKNIGIMEFLKGRGSIDITGTFVPNFNYNFFSALWREARQPNTFTLHAFVLVCLIAEAIILFL